MGSNRMLASVVRDERLRVWSPAPPTYSLTRVYDEDVEAAPPESGIFVIDEGSRAPLNDVHTDATRALERLDSTYAPRHEGDAALARIARYRDRS